MRLSDVIISEAAVPQSWDPAQLKDAWDKAQELPEFHQLTAVAKFAPGPQQVKRGTMVFAYSKKVPTAHLVVKQTSAGKFSVVNKTKEADSSSYGTYATKEAAQQHADTINDKRSEHNGSYVIYAHGQIRNQQGGQFATGITKVATPTLTSHDLLENYRRMMERVLQLIDAKGKTAPKMTSYGVDDSSKVNAVEGGVFYVHNLGVRDLTGSPEVVSSYMIEKCDELVTLKGGPKRLDSKTNHATVTIKRCKSLLNLDGIATASAGGRSLRYHIENCKTLHDISALPLETDGVHISGCALTSLKGIGQDYLKVVYGDGLSFRDIKLKSHALGLFLIEGSLQWFHISGFKGAEIIERHMKAHNRKAAMIDCQHELIDAGLEDLAQL